LRGEGREWKNKEWWELSEAEGQEGEGNTRRGWDERSVPSQLI